MRTVTKPVKTGKTPGKTVLVGTYRQGQLEKWVLPRGFYNYPIHDGDAAIRAAAPEVSELWLYLGKAGKRRFAATFEREVSREDLDALGYSRGKGRPHAEKYLLFRVEPLPKGNPRAKSAKSAKVETSHGGGEDFGRAERADPVDSAAKSSASLRLCVEKTATGGANAPSEPRPRILVRLTDFKRSAKRLAEIREAAKGGRVSTRAAKGAEDAKPFSYLDFLPDDLLSDWADSLCVCEAAESIRFNCESVSESATRHPQSREDGALCEDSRFEEIAKLASSDAVARTFAAGLPVTFWKDGRLFHQFPDGMECPVPASEISEVIGVSCQ